MPRGPPSLRKPAAPVCWHGAALQEQPSLLTVTEGSRLGLGSACSARGLWQQELWEQSQGC